jgi:hypothetical protein
MMGAHSSPRVATGRASGRFRDCHEAGSAVADPASVGLA